MMSVAGDMIGLQVICWIASNLLILPTKTYTVSDLFGSEIALESV